MYTMEVRIVHNAPRLRLLGAAVAIAALGVSAVGVAGAEAAATKPSIEMRITTPTATKIMRNKARIKGNLKHRNGRGAKAGTKVYLLSWPDDATLAKTKIGEAIKLIPVASTGTDSGGQFGFSSQATSSMSSDLGEIVVPSSGGAVSAAIEVPDAGQATSAVTATAPAAPGSTSIVNNGVTAGELSSQSTGDIGTLTVPEDSQSSARPMVLAAGLGPIRNDLFITFPITTAELMTTWNQKAIIGQTASLTGNADVQFTYTKGASSSLGVGVSGSGKYGSYSQSAKKTVSSTLTEGFAKRSGKHNYYYQTLFQYGKYKVRTFQNGMLLWTDYEIRPIKYIGGEYGYSASLPASPRYCVKKDKGGSITIDRSNAITWTNAVSIGGSVGVNLTGQTGYSSNTKMKYTWVRGGGYACGQSDYPSGTPYVVIAK